MTISGKKTALTHRNLQKRLIPNQTPQISEGLKGSHCEKQYVIHPEPDQRGRNWYPEEEHRESHCRQGHPRVIKRQGNRIFRGSPKCVTVALEQPNMHQVWCKMVADAVPAALYNSGKFCIVHDRRFDRADSSNLA